jgi:hypothetical protein
LIVSRPFRRQAEGEDRTEGRSNGYCQAAAQLANLGRRWHKWWPERSGHHIRVTNMLGDVIRLVSIAVLFLTPSHPAAAADHGQLGPTSSEMRAWANSLQNKLSEGCCSTADGWKPEAVEYDMRGNKYRVKIEGQWYDVPPSAMIDLPNKFGFPVVWYYKTWDNGIRPSISIRCFIPGAGG